MTMLAEVCEARARASTSRQWRFGGLRSLAGSEEDAEVAEQGANRATGRRRGGGGGGRGGGRRQEEDEDEDEVPVVVPIATVEEATMSFNCV